MDKWDAPYRNKHTTKLSWMKKTGLYIIRDKNTKQIVYVGMSRSCLYRGMYRHFQSWNDPRQYRVTYLDRDNYEVRLILVEFEKVEYFERRLIWYLNPRDNLNRYEEEKEHYDNMQDELNGVDPFGEEVEEVPF
jgi:hypothetical protein